MYSSKVKQVFRKFTIRGSEMTRIKSRVVSMAAYAAMLVFIFAGGAGAANCPPDDEVNLRWSVTPPTFMYHDNSTKLYVKNDHNGGTYSWSCSDSALGQFYLASNPPKFITASNGVGQVTIYCTYTFEESGQPCSYTISHPINVVGANIFTSSGGVVCVGRDIVVNLSSFPSTAEGEIMLELTQGSDKAHMIHPNGSSIPSGWTCDANECPSSIRIRGDQVSQSRGDVKFKFTFYPPSYGTASADEISLTVVDIDLYKYTYPLELGEDAIGMDYWIDAPAGIQFNVTSSVKDRSRALQYSSSTNINSGWGDVYWNGVNTSNGKYSEPRHSPYKMDISFKSGNRTVFSDSADGISIQLYDIEAEKKSFSHNVSTTLIDDEVEISIGLQGEWELEDVNPNYFGPTAVLRWMVHINDDSYSACNPGISGENRVTMDYTHPSFSVPLSEFLSDDITVGIYMRAYGEEYFFEEFTLDEKRISNVPCSLVPDYDRNGVIDASDEARWNNNEVFHFWVNDDNDDPDSEIFGNDFPGQEDEDDADYHNYKIDGTRDLIDFFPVRISLDDALCDPSTYSYHLSQNDLALNFVHTELTGDGALKYLRDVTTAQAMKEARAEPVFPSISSLSLTDQGFLNRRPASGGDFAGRPSRNRKTSLI